MILWQTETRLVDELEGGRHELLQMDGWQETGCCVVGGVGSSKALMSENAENFGAGASEYDYY